MKGEGSPARVDHAPLVMSNREEPVRVRPRLARVVAATALALAAVAIGSASAGGALPLYSAQPLHPWRQAPRRPPPASVSPVPLRLRLPLRSGLTTRTTSSYRTEASRAGAAGV